MGWGLFCKTLTSILEFTNKVLTRCTAPVRSLENPYKSCFKTEGGYRPSGGTNWKSCALNGYARQGFVSGDGGESGSTNPLGSSLGIKDFVFLVQLQCTFRGNRLNIKYRIAVLSWDIPYIVLH